MNGAELSRPFLDTDVLFPYTGTHWSVYCAAMAATNLIGQINPVAPTNDLPAPVVLGMEYKSEPYDIHDRDIADLLNLPRPYRRVPDRYPHPVFAPPTARPARPSSWATASATFWQRSRTRGVPRRRHVLNQLPTQGEQKAPSPRRSRRLRLAHALARDRVPAKCSTRSSC